MSYNIDSIQYLGKGRLKIKRGIAVALWEKYGEDCELPENNWLSDLRGSKQLKSTQDPEEYIEIQHPNFRGEGSGYDYPDKFKELFGATAGKADLLLVWEGGDRMTGVRVINGRVEEKKVKIVLEDEDQP